MVSLRRIIVSVDSLDAALVFYSDALGLALQSRTGVIARLSTADGVEVMLHERPTEVPKNPTVSPGFAVDDVDRVIAAWTEHGGEVIDPPSAQPWGERMAVVRDADGHVVCVSGIV